MSIDAAVFDRYVRDGDGAALTAVLLDLDEPGRRALGVELEARIKAETGWWQGRHHRAGCYGLAVAACAPSAARAAALLVRPGMRHWQEISTDHFLEITRARGVSWVGDLGVRLAGRMPARGVDLPGELAFVTALLTEGKAEPPRTEGFVRSWLSDVLEGRRSTVADRMRADPFLESLLPAVFEIDGLGDELAVEGWDNGVWSGTPRFPAAVAALAAEGRVDRGWLLGATVDRLVRGGRAVSVRPFTMLHDVLEPTVAEMAAHTAGYVRLLSVAPSPVAGMAQRSLRAVDEAGLLGLESVLEASAAALLRREKTLVKTQLTWLDRVARRVPERAGEVLETVAVALGHPALDVQERALDVIARHLPRVPPESATRARIAEATSLPGDLGVRAAALLGTALAAGPVPVVALPPAQPPAALVAIGSAAELAEEVVALLQEETGVRWERVLAGLVALAPSGLSATLAPVLARGPGPFGGSWGRMPFLGAAIRTVTGQDLDPVMRERLRAAVTDARIAQLRMPASLLSLRVAEVAAGLAGDAPPVLLATPTDVTGSLDAGVLVDRLGRLEAAGRTPWPLDLQQALLRVPRVTAPEVLARADALTSPAGRQLAGWLRAGGLPDPVGTRFEQCTRDAGGRVVVRRVVVNLEPGRSGEGRIALEDVFVSLTHRARPDYQDDYFLLPTVLAMVLPHHREVSAAWALPGIAALADQDGRDASLLPLLAECSGPAGPAMTLVMAYGLGARQPADRVAAVDALLLLAADDRPAGGGPGFAGRLGTALGDLCSDGTVKLSRVVPALADALPAGAAGVLWELVRAALPPLLPASPRGLPDLLELATRVATAAGARGEVPGLAALAARGGGSRLTREAKRLHVTLTAD